jgi:LuxR family transcriptional regulator, positive regulator of biofilm formation
MSLKKGLNKMSADDDDDGLRIYIVGKNQLHYELISYCLENELNAHCVFRAELSCLQFGSEEIVRPQVLLFDCLDLDLADLQERLDLYAPALPGQIHIALFNAKPECKLERVVKQHKICGIFYKDDSRPIFIKGIRAILDGQLWLSRKLMSQCILMPQEHCNSIPRNLKMLSRREKVILENVASGASNQEIADQLHISVHTVKTHLYKIYRKINVPNRLQAALWLNACLLKSSVSNVSETPKDQQENCRIKVCSGNSFA